jgi:hypothetical protein
VLKWLVIVFPEIELNDCFNRMLVRVVGQVYAVDA